MPRAPERSALLIIDIQNDFLPGGALAVPHGDRIIAPTNRLMAQNFRTVIASQDWHPPAHCSFTGQGGPWPAHCIAATHGAAFPASLDQTHIAHIVRKGMAADRDSYSAFSDNRSTLHPDRARSGLEGLLHELEIRHLVFAGLAQDVCVLHTARDARCLGFDVTLSLPASAAIDSDRATVLAQFLAIGVDISDRELP